MRATFITTALENGATLDDVQRAARAKQSPALPSSTTSEAIIPRSRRASLQLTELSGMQNLLKYFCSILENYIVI
jgi:hypothetical protein